MSLAEASEARKTRLEALRKRKAGGADAGQENGDTSPASLIQYRNFDPNARTLRKHYVPGEQQDMNQDEEMPPSSGEILHQKDTVERNVEGLAENIISQDEDRRAQELNVFNIAPKRANWDLKRQLEVKLARLDRKTQEAVHTLIRQRLAAQRGNDAADVSDLVGAMRTEADKAGNDDDSDED